MPLIVVIDQNQQNLELLQDFLNKYKYKSQGINNLTELELFFADETKMASSQIALVLIDLAGFDKTIWKYTEILRGWEIPFLILSPGKNPYLLQEVTKRGASQVLIKPLVSKDLLNIIQSLLGQ